MVEVVTEDEWLKLLMEENKYNETIRLSSQLELAVFDELGLILAQILNLHQNKAVFISSFFQFYFS